MSRLSRGHQAYTSATVRSRRALGALVLVGSLIVVVLGVAKPNPFAQHRTVRAMFSDGAAIGVVGADVRMAGAKVGDITDVERVGDHALVTMQIENGVAPVGADATAELRPRTPFEGTAFIELDPGSASGDRLGDAVIPLARTRTFVPVDQALRVAPPDTRAALREDLLELRRTLRRGAVPGVQDVLRRAPHVVERLAPAARAAQGRHGDELRRAVNGFATTTGALARRQRDLAALVAAAPGTFAALNTESGKPLDRLIGELPVRMAQLQAGGASLRSLVDRLDTVGTDLRPALRALVPAMDQTRPLLRSARPVLEDAPTLLADLRRALSAGARSSAPARGLLEALDPSLVLLNASLLPALERRTSLGMPSYLQFLTLFQGGGGASRGFQTAAQGARPSVGPGHFMRFGARFFTGMGYPLPPCSALAAIHPDLAAQLSTAGGCAS